MLKIKLNKEIYDLPLDESYKEKLNISKDIISVDGLSDAKAYKLLTKTFLYVSLVMASLENHNCPSDLFRERNEIFRNVSRINELQKQSAQQGFYSESNKLLNDFLVIMLKHYEKYMQMTQESSNNITR